MGSFLKRVLAVLLCVTVVFTAMPMGNLANVRAASLLDNSPEYNREILEALAGVVGSEKEAEEYYDLLQKYGLIDNEGNVIDSWDIELDGKKMTIDEIKEILSGDYDPGKCVWVDGSPVYLGDLKTMIEIEEYLAYIKDTYFSDEEWTEEQKVNYLELLEQLQSGGIKLVSNAPANGDIVGARGISHEGRVSVSLMENTVARSLGVAFDAHFSVSLSHAAPGSKVSFNYKAISASRSVADSGVEKTYTITADRYGSATGQFTVSVLAADPLSDTDPLYSSESYFYLNCDTITNALFTKNGSEDCNSLSIEVKCPGTAVDSLPDSMHINVEGTSGIVDGTEYVLNVGTYVDDTKRKIVEGTGIRYAYTYSNLYYDIDDSTILNKGKKSLNAKEQNLLYWGLLDTVTIIRDKGDVIDYSDPTQDMRNRGWAHYAENREPYKFDGRDSIDDKSYYISFCLPKASDTDCEYINIEGVPILTRTNGSNRTSLLYTWQYIINKQIGNDYTNKSELYNYSVGIRPDPDMSKWDATNLLPVGKNIASESTCAAITKGERITELSFAGGMAMYPLTVSNDGGLKVGTVDNDNSGFYSNNKDILYENGQLKKDIYPFVGRPLFMSATLTRAEAPNVRSITVPEGDYYPGEYIPIVVRYSELAKAGATIEVNGTTLTARENSASNIHTFLYEVQKDGEVSLVVTKVNAVNLEHDETADPDLHPELLHPMDYTGLFDPDGDGSVKPNSYNLTGFTIHPEIKSSAFTGMTTSVDNSGRNPVMSVEVNISNDINATQWIANVNDQFEMVGNTLVSKYLRVRLSSEDGEYKSEYLKLKSEGENITGGKLVLLDGGVSLPLNTSGRRQKYIAELYLANNTFDDRGEITDNMLDPVIGKNGSTQVGIAYSEIDTIVLVSAADLSATVSVTKENSNDPYLNSDGDPSPIYLDEGPEAKASFTLAGGKQYNYGNRTKVTTYDENGNLVDPTADFAWKSSDPTIAVIDSAGLIAPTGADGEVHFILTALNGGIEGKAVSVSTNTLVFAGGSTPFFRVPQANATYTIVDNKEFTVNWSSNLCERNGSTPTVFEIRAYRGDHADLSSADASALVFSKDCRGTSTNPVSSYTFRAGELPYSYENPDNRFSIFITNTNNGVTRTYKISVEVESQPAVVKLAELSDYYILDNTGSVNIRWNISNFARFSSENPADPSDLFEVLITKDGQEVMKTNNPGTAGENGSYTGSVILDNLDFTANPNDKNGYRETYIVSVKAKNGASNSWSYDSCILYVYDEDALRIWIQPTSETDTNGRVTGTVITGNGSYDSLLTMKNDAIASMDQNQILALKRDISLRNVISANYGEYAWTELSDQLEWASSNNNVATVNYRQGTLYEDIRGLSYVTYRPATDFLVSGLKDGQTTITVKHSLTGMTDSLTVNVETLKDKLYIFQCYPQVETTLIYTDANGVEKRAYSDSKGAAAIYEENGIKGDVYCKSQFAGNTYFGTYYYSDLKSGENDSTKLELYPCNNINLRRAAYAYLYVKNPDGTPYTGSVMFRGGVYIDGVYYEDIKFALNGATTVSLKGNEDNFSPALGSTGKLEVSMDITQMERALGKSLSPDMKVSYSFIISKSDDGATESTDYYPMYVFIDANASENLFLSSGEAVATFRANDNPAGRHSFIVEQYVTLQDSKGKNLRKTSVRDSKEAIGISDSYPQAEMETLVMWWGEDDPGNNNAYQLQLYTKDGYKVAAGAGQSEQGVAKYAFSKSPLTSYTVHIDERSLGNSVKKGEKKALYLEYCREAGKMSRREDLPFKLGNIIGIGKTEDSAELKEELIDVKSFFNSDGKGAANGDAHGDDFVSGALGLLAKMSFTDSDDMWVTLNITPTTDPTKFMALLKVNFSNMDDHEASQNGVEIIGQDSSQEVEYVPSVEELPYGGAKKWANEQKEEALTAKEETTGFDKDFGYSIGGYMETLIYYNFAEQKWEMQVLDGGFNAGLGIELSWSWNVMVGPVPITSEIKVGGQVRVSMDAITTAYLNKTQKKTELATEYLTKLRIYLYVSVFAGVGFDYSVVALKLGIFGQLNLEMTFEWLNRPYLEEHKNENVKMLATPEGRDSDTGTANLSGQHFVLDGLLGIKFCATILFIEYEKVLFSVGFDLLNESTGDYDKIERLWGNNQKNLRAAIDELINGPSASIVNVNGQKYVALDLATVMENRDYLNDPERRRAWITKTAMSVTANEKLTTLETNTYPYADPKITRSGDDLYYLSDMNSTDVNDTRIVNAHKLWDPQTQTTYYHNNGEVYNDFDYNMDSHYVGRSYGDGSFDLAYGGGTYDRGDLTITAWTRRMKDNGKNAGDVLSSVDQIVSLNGTEVFANVQDYSSTNPIFTSVRLTENETPDLAPSVAASSDRAIVAWRNVAVSDEGESNNFNVADFNKKDTILYKIYYAPSHQWWSQTYTLYNGSSGNVKGIETAVMDDGTAAVVYTLDTDGNDATTNDREIVYAIIDDNGDVARTVRVTNDTNLDENPQIAVTKFSKNGDQSFVIGWYSQSETDHNAVGSNTTAAKTSSADIKMIDIDKYGNIGGKLPGSLSQVAGGEDINITSNFKFISALDSLVDGLGITWVERAEAKASDLPSASGSGITTTGSVNSDAERDVLKAVKFYPYGNDNDMIGLTSVLNVAEMPSGTLIDSYDAVLNTQQDRTSYYINAVILGTTYGVNGQTERKTAYDTAGNEVTITIPKEESNMYYVQESFTNGISVPDVYFERDSIKRASRTRVQFGVKNEGVLPIIKLTFNIGGDETVYDNLNLLPGSTISLGADYDIPADAIVDPNYVITAQYTAGPLSAFINESANFDRWIYDQSALEKTATGTLKLNNPDLEITSAEIVEEADGKRVIQLKLNNTLDAALANSGKKVGISFYTDATMQNEIPRSYLAPVIISSDAELKMIDEGGYSIQKEFDVAGFVQYQKANASGTITSDEIPDAGITVYMSADILADKLNAPGQYEAQPEPNITNNTAQVECDNLKSRTGQDVILASNLEVVGDQTKVTVELQNTSIAQTASGNLIVSLLDENGKVLEQQQSYRAPLTSTRRLRAVSNGLITLGKEEKTTKTFTFNQAGASVTTTYSNLILDNDNADLASVSFSNIPGVTEDSFKFVSSGKYEAETEITDGVTTTIVASAKSGNATITITGSDETGSEETTSIGNAVSKTLQTKKKSGGSTITVTVTAKDGTTKEYKLKISYKTEQGTSPSGPSYISGPSYTPEQQDTEEKTEEKEETKEEEEEKKEEEPEEPGYKISKAKKNLNGLKIDKEIKVVQKNKAVTVSWGEVPDADTYELYIAYDGEDLSKVKPIVVKSTATKKKITKIGGKTINPKKNIKFKINAYKQDKDKKVNIGSSIEFTVAGVNNTKYTNVSKITLNKKSTTLAKGKTFKLKATLVLDDKKKKMIPSEDAKVRYYTTNTKIATVDKNGKIKAVGKGTCYVFAFSRNGACTKIKVTVK